MFEWFFATNGCLSTNGCLLFCWVDQVCANINIRRDTKKITDKIITDVDELRRELAYMRREIQNMKRI